MLRTPEAAGHKRRRMVLLPQNFGGGQCELPGRNQEILYDFIWNRGENQKPFKHSQAQRHPCIWSKAQAEPGGQAGSVATDLVSEGWHWHNAGSRSKDGLGPACSPDSGKWGCRSRASSARGSLGESGTLLVVTETRAYRGQLSLSAFSLILNQNLGFFFFSEVLHLLHFSSCHRSHPQLVPLGTTTVLGQQPGFTSSTGIFTLAYGEG